MNRPTLILLVGIPGSGKTTYAEKYIKKNPGTVHLSSDKIRKELWGDEATQGDNSVVFSRMHDRTLASFGFGKSVIYDATNITRKDRASIIAACPKFVKIECHIIWAPIETCIERDEARCRTVGKEVIDRMLKRFQAPYYDEGIHEIKVIWPNNFNDYEYTGKVLDMMKIPHDNPHHTLGVFDHCLEADNYIVRKTGDYTVGCAAMFHDIGKPYVKSFVDSKGNPCEIAHYYQHQCVGAWISYGVGMLEDCRNNVAWLISTHMDPYLNTKYYNRLPAYLKKQVDLLHEADRNAH